MASYATAETEIHVAAWILSAWRADVLLRACEFDSLAGCAMRSRLIDRNLIAQLTEHACPRAVLRAISGALHLV